MPRRSLGERLRNTPAPVRALAALALVAFLALPYRTVARYDHEGVETTFSGVQELLVAASALRGEVAHEVDAGRSADGLAALRARARILELALLPLATVAFAVWKRRRSSGAPRVAGLLAVGAGASWLATWAVADDHASARAVDMQAVAFAIELAPILAASLGACTELVQARLAPRFERVVGGLALAIAFAPLCDRYDSFRVHAVGSGARATVALLALALLVETLRTERATPDERPG